MLAQLSPELPRAGAIHSEIDRNSYTEFQSLSTAKLDPANASVDGSTGMDVGPWELAIFGKNLTNRLLVTGVDTDRNVPTTYTVAPPRTIGLEARYKY